MVNITSTIVKLQDIHIRCYIAGDSGPPVILLHGAGVDSAMMSWGEVIPFLAKHYRVFAPDLPGYGASDKPDVVYSLAYYVNILKHLMEHFGLKKAHLMGLSLGGGISLAYTLEYPDQVGKLGLVASWGLFSKLPYHRLTYWYSASFFNELSYKLVGKSRWFVKWTLINSLFGDSEKVSDDLIDYIFESLKEPDAGKAFISFQRSEITPTGLKTKLVEKLSDLSHPTILVHGSDDPAVPVIHAKHAYEMIPDATLYIMEGCKHWPQKERPEEFSQVILEFLNEQ